MKTKILLLLLIAAISVYGTLRTTNLFNNGIFVGVEGIEQAKATTNDYALVFSCEYGIWDELNIGAENTGANSVTVKITGQIHRIGSEYTLYEKVIEDSTDAVRLLSLIDAPYSKINLYVKSTLTDSVSTLKAEYIMR